MARGRRKEQLMSRSCRGCGGELNKLDGLVCSKCIQIGGSRKAIEGTEITHEDAVGLLLACREKQKRGIKVLSGLCDLEICALAKLHKGTPWHSYGRIRAYCDSTGKLPPADISV